MKIIKSILNPNILFYFSVCLYVFICLLPYAFVTHDGPTHLYNSHIINEILFSNNEFFCTYHRFNPNWAQPNLTGYVILSSLQLILPFLWAEKILIAIYVIIISLGFRFFLKQISTSSEWYSLMIFPFIFSSILFWGFYNFLFGLALLFWFIGTFEKHKKAMGIYQFIRLFTLSIVIFYSHALIFILSILYISISIGLDFINKKVTYQIFLKLILLLSPGVVLFLVYLNQQKSSALTYENGFSLTNRISQLWLKIDSLAFTGYAEGNYLKILYFVIVSLTVITLTSHWKDKRNIASSTFIYFIVFFFIMLLLPNSGLGGGIIILRLNLLFFLFWIVWLSSQTLQRPVKFLILVFYLISLPLLFLRWQVIKSGSDQAKVALESTENLIAKNSIISTVHYIPVRGYIGKYQIHSYIDITGNIDSYLAIRDNSISLHNYEANSPIMGSNFPIIWQDWKSTNFVWQNLTDKEIIEYFDLKEFNQKWKTLPKNILSFGSLEKTEKAKSIWDPENSFSLIKADPINFINIYSIKTEY